jgi:hypothetical protein
MLERKDRKKRLDQSSIPPAAEGRQKEISPTRMALITLALLVVILIFASQTLQPQLGNPQFTTTEGKLVKNAQLGIEPGESYTYLYSVGNTSVNLTYAVFEGPGCNLVSLAEGHAMVCLDSQGNDAGGQNTSYLVPAVILMKPWMLAVADGWTWNASTYIVYQGLVKHVSDANYTELRREYFKGREAYVVRISSTNADPVWDWVDSEKRVLLREIGTDYEINMTNGLQFANDSVSG